MNEDDLVRRAAEERESIVARYKRGREDGTHNDPKDDRAYEIYRFTDRYGFIQ